MLLYLLWVHRGIILERPCSRRDRTRPDRLQSLLYTPTDGFPSQDLFSTTARPANLTPAHLPPAASPIPTTAVFVQSIDCCNPRLSPAHRLYGHSIDGRSFHQRKKNLLEIVIVNVSVRGVGYSERFWRMASFTRYHRLSPPMEAKQGPSSRKDQHLQR